MIDCDKCREMISCLLDGELDEAEQALVHEHIDSCPECRLVYKAFCEISDEMREPEPLPEGLHEKIMSGIAAKPKKKSGIVWIKYLSAAACLALVIIAGAKSGILNSGSDDSDASFLKDAQTVTNGAAAYSDDSADNEEVYPQQAFSSAMEVDDATAEELGALLTPARAADDVMPDHCTAFPDWDPDYCVSLPDGETLLIYFDLGRVYADFGDGAFLTSATVDEVSRLLG